MTRVADGSTFAFKNNYYWLVEDAGYARGYPRLISQDWDGLPGKAAKQSGEGGVKEIQLIVTG